METAKLLMKQMELMNECGTYSLIVQLFINRHSDNAEFVKLAKEAQHLREVLRPRYIVKN
jgi:hypothetical protein